MSDKGQSTKMSWWNKVSEDWWAVILGFLLIALVYLGLLGQVPW